MAISLLAMVSCGVSKKIFNDKSAGDINVDKLKDACDFADAMLICFAEMKTILDENIDKKEADISEEVKIQAQNIEKKMDEIQKAMVIKKISEEDMNKCDSYRETEDIKNEMKKMIEEVMEKEMSE